MNLLILPPTSSVDASVSRRLPVAVKVPADAGRAADSADSADSAAAAGGGGESADIDVDVDVAVDVAVFFNIEFDDAAFVEAWCDNADISFAPAFASSTSVTCVPLRLFSSLLVFPSTNATLPWCLLAIIVIVVCLKIPYENLQQFLIFVIFLKLVIFLYSCDH